MENRPTSRKASVWEGTGAKRGVVLHHHAASWAAASRLRSGSKLKTRCPLISMLCHQNAGTPT
eukprot:scaffold201485_cov19-Tisochrysis_lutea.AAC.3